MRWLDGVTDSVDMSLSKLWGIVKNKKSGMLQSHGISKSQILATQNNYKSYLILRILKCYPIFFNMAKLSSDRNNKYVEFKRKNINFLQQCLSYTRNAFKL